MFISIIILSIGFNKQSGKLSISYLYRPLYVIYSITIYIDFYKLYTVYIYLSTYVNFYKLNISYLSILSLARFTK